MARIPLAQQVEALQNQVLELQKQNSILTDNNSHLKNALEASLLVDFDFDYSVAIAIKRIYTDTVISCMPNKQTGDIKDFRFPCSAARHAELVAEFARYKTKSKQ